MHGRPWDSRKGWIRVIRVVVAAGLATVGAIVAGAQTTGTSQEPNAEAVVLGDGLRIETRDGFRIDGQSVVFTDLQGKLRSVPLRDVDLKASRATAERADEDRPRIPEESEKPEPVLVLENDDVPRVEEAERRRALAAEAERRRVHDRAAARSRVEQGTGGGRRARPRAPSSPPKGTTVGLATIGHWSTAPSRQTGGTQIVGSVVNPTGENLDRLTVQLKLYDEDGKLVKTGRAFVDRSRLPPRSSTNFHYVDPSLPSLDGLSVEFRVTARALSWGARPEVSTDDIPTFRPGDGA